MESPLPDFDPIEEVITEVKPNNWLTLMEVKNIVTKDFFKDWSISGQRQKVKEEENNDDDEYQQSRFQTM